MDRIRLVRIAVRDLRFIKRVVAAAAGDEDDFAVAVRQQTVFQSDLLGIPIERFIIVAQVGIRSIEIHKRI